MASVISQVTQLDKEMREKVAALEEERSKLPVFLREKRKEISDKYQKEAKKRIKERQKEIEQSLDKTEELSNLELSQSISEITSEFDLKKDEWISDIYNKIIQDLQGE